MLDLSKLINPQLPEEINDNQKADILDKLAKYSSKTKQATMSSADLYNLLAVLEEIEKRKETSGIAKWFPEDGPYSIHNLPKHKAFFDATKDHIENLFLGGNRCKIAGTKVWMADGSEKNIEDVIIGDEVLAYDIATANLVKTSVIDTYKGWADNVHYYESPRKEMGFGATANHEVLCFGSGYKIPAKRKLEDFRYYDKAVVPSRWEYEGIDTPLTDDQCKFIGLLVGDGHLCPRQDAFKLTNTNESILKFAEKVAAELGLKSRRNHYKNCTDLYFTKGYNSNKKSALAELLIRMGLYGTSSGTKFIPKEILLAPVSKLKAFINGLLAADGSYAPGRIDLWTTSEQLAKDFQKAVLRLGASSSISFKVHSNPRHADCYRVSISGDGNVQRIGDSFHKKVKLRGADRISKNHKTQTLKLVSKLPDQEVYCITLEHPDHLFVANGFITGNSGKTTAGAFVTAVCATGMYPEWWNGIYFDGPVSCWACGQTGQTTRDTVQEALLGPPGAWGTGMIPADCLGKITARPGVPGAVDTVQIKHVSGRWSTIGFKSYDQKVASFFGTAKHIVWLDEPCDDDVYNECLIRTMTTGGRIIHTITPKKGLTRLLADYLADCDLLAGSEAFEGLSTAKALMDYENRKNADDDE